MYCILLDLKKLFHYQYYNKALNNLLVTFILYESWFTALYDYAYKSMM